MDFSSEKASLFVEPARRGDSRRSYPFMMQNVKGKFCIAMYIASGEKATGPVLVVKVVEFDPSDITTPSVAKKQRLPPLLRQGGEWVASFSPPCLRRWMRASFARRRGGEKRSLLYTFPRTQNHNGSINAAKNIRRRVRSPLCLCV